MTKTLLKQQELDRFLSTKPLAVDQCPLFWWKENADSYPIFSLVAKQYLGIPSTSVPCERVFSTSGNVITKKRAALTPENAEMLVYMNINKEK